MDSQIYLVVAATFIGFVALAFVLLFPVYRFLRREEKLSDDWTSDSIARRRRQAAADGAMRDPSGDGAAAPGSAPPEVRPAPRRGASDDGPQATA